MTQWLQQGFIGPRAAVDAARVALAQDPRVGGMLPEAGQDPQRVVKGDDTLWAFGVAVTELLPVPAGLQEVEPPVVAGAMAGGTF
jgi:hypothetical protein